MARSRARRLPAQLLLPTASHSARLASALRQLQQGIGVAGAGCPAAGHGRVAGLVACVLASVCSWQGEGEEEWGGKAPAPRRPFVVFLLLLLLTAVVDVAPVVLVLGHAGFPLRCPPRGLLRRHGLRLRL